MCEQTELLKENINKAEYVSFDIFDTLIVRPFYRPTDLFYLLDSEFEKYIQTNICFHEIRINGEDGARKELKKKEPYNEDITIDEIYDFICRRYTISIEICQRIMEKEKELEIFYANGREYTVQLYQYAVEKGKKIIICSDMYLDIETISSILKKNGITKWDRLFLSSDIKKLKRTGNMYDYIIDELGCDAGQILHIGDDKIADIEQAVKKGIQVEYIPKTKTIFEEADTYAGSKKGVLAAGTLINYGEVKKSVGYGCMTAIVANKFFDNPYRNFNDKGTIFGDSYYIGFYFLGMHIIGILKWIVENVENYGYRKVNFFSRDGWLIKQVYDIYCRYNGGMPPSDYIYVSREALLPAQIETRLDFFDLPIEYKKYSPETLLLMLDFCTVDMTKEKKQSILEQYGISWDKKFGRIEDYQFFIEKYIQYLYDKRKHQKSCETIKTYLSKIGKNEIMFDMGYSGRIQCGINRLLNEQTDAFLIHSDSQKNLHMKRKGRFREHCFYDYSPAITGMLREFLMSEIGPPCIGYQQDNGEVLPLFEKDDRSEEEKNVLSRMYEGVDDFVNIFFECFAEYMEYIPFKSQEVSLPFEGFLREATENEYMAFQNCFSDDKIYGKNPAINIARFWRNRQKELLGKFIAKNSIHEGE